MRIIAAVEVAYDPTLNRVLDQSRRWMMLAATSPVRTAAIVTSGGIVSTAATRTASRKVRSSDVLPRQIRTDTSSPAAARTTNTPARTNHLSESKNAVGDPPGIVIRGWPPTRRAAATDRRSENQDQSDDLTDRARKEAPGGLPPHRSRPDTRRTYCGSIDQESVDHARADHALASQAKSDQARADHARALHARADHARADHARASHTAPLHARADHARAAQSSPLQARADHARASHCSSLQARADHARAIHSSSLQARADHARADHARASQSSADHARADHARASNSSGSRASPFATTAIDQARAAQIRVCGLSEDHARARASKSPCCHAWANAAHACVSSSLGPNSPAGTSGLSCGTSRSAVGSSGHGGLQVQGAMARAVDALQVGGAGQEGLDAVGGERRVRPEDRGHRAGDHSRRHGSAGAAHVAASDLRLRILLDRSASGGSGGDQRDAGRDEIGLVGGVHGAT